MRTVTTALSLSLVATLAGTAAAEEIHQTATLDRAAGISGAGADLSVISFDGGTVSRLDLHGQWMSKSGLGAYGQLAISQAFLDETGLEPLTGDLEPLSLSNLEVGAQYSKRMGNGMSLVAHAGLVLPTAQKEAGVLFTNVLASQRRFNDLVLMFPDLTAARLGVTPTWQRGVVFVRANLGLDVVLDAGDAMETPDPIGHANLAVGAKEGKWSGAFELVNVFTTGDVAEGQDRFQHTGAFSVSYDAGRLQPSLSVVSPLDDGARGEAISVGAGIAAKF